jgi:hypothetical protein
LIIIIVVKTQQSLQGLFRTTNERAFWGGVSVSLIINNTDDKTQALPLEYGTVASSIF